MPVPLELFVRQLHASGLMSADEVHAFVESLASDERPTSAEDLARQLCERGKLTRFQAQAIYQGKGQGLVLGNYILLDRLGKGGMGQVYKALHRRLERIVALKVLPAPSTRSPEAVKRFQREARAAARLCHPNIVTAFDADEARGVPFLVMEYVEGEDLAQWVKKHGPLPVSVAVDYTLQAARGLEYAHRQGVIHRDIKPSNLLLDRRGQVKVLNMGLARIEQAANVPRGNGEDLTRTGQIMGTVDYMAPEQSLNTHDADARSDIYSLGCTLFALLTGDPPYRGQTLVERILAHREAPIPSLRSFRPDVPEALDRLFQRMVAKQPLHRPQSMEEVVAELEAILRLSAEPIHAGGAATHGAVGQGETYRFLGAPRGQPPLVSPGRSFLEELLHEPIVLPHRLAKPSGRGWLRQAGNRQRLLIAGIVTAAVFLAVVVGLLLRSSVPPQDRTLSPPLAKVDRASHFSEEKRTGTASIATKSAKAADFTGLPNIQETPVVANTQNEEADARSQASGSLDGWSEPVNLGPPINTRWYGGHPVLSSDKLTLWFTSDRPGGQGGPDIWMAKRASVNDPFSEPENLGGTVNSKWDEHLSTVSPDGLLLVFQSTRQRGYGKNDLWISRRVSPQDPWLEPTNLGAPLNTSWDEGTADLSRGGVALLFNSDRPGGYGGGDIWLFQRISFGNSFGEPVNIGPPINTSALEGYPRLSSDELTLYFGSTRPGGSGQCDLWKSTRVSLKAAWQEPVNLGGAVNTSAWEGAPWISVDGCMLLFQSDRPEGHGGSDIWMCTRRPRFVTPPTGKSSGPSPQRSESSR